jgi:transposase
MKDTEPKHGKRHNKVTFKPYVQNQGWLLPPTLDELIPVDHKVRLVSQAIDGMDLEPILNTYKGGGTSAYHPRMLLKVLVYGYIEQLYSSRKIEKALGENICFMWLSGMQMPDHGTLNGFRKNQLKQTVKDVFAQVLLLLIEQGYVRLQDYYIDGSKIESVAGRYTFVWAKNVSRYKAGLLNKIAALLEHIEQANERDETQAKEQVKVPQISDSEALSRTIDQLNEQLHDQLDQNKALKKKLTKLENEYLPKLEGYEEQERLLDGRNSYSKTDVDATFMRTKDDHLNKGQLKPCYNIQLGTEKQWIINYSLHQTASDMAVFTDHMDDTLDVLESITAPIPKRVSGDAGYGSEENYEYLEQKQIDAYLKYPGYYQEKKGQYDKKPFHWATLYYDQQGDFFICPMGQMMTYVGRQVQKTTTGYLYQIKQYQAQRCQACPLRGACHKGAGNRIISVNQNAQRYRQKAKHRLNSLRGIKMRKQRNVDVEPVFGHIKANRCFKRFTLRGLDGVSTEIGLLAIAHNLNKWWGKIINLDTPMPDPPAKTAKYRINEQKTSKINLIPIKKRA